MAAKLSKKCKTLTIFQNKTLSNQPFFTPYLLPIKWSFFPSFPTNHENNPAANKADNTPDGKQLVHDINPKTLE